MNATDVAAPERIRIEHLPGGFGVGTDRPRLSWVIPSAPAGFTQRAYEIEWTPDGGDATLARVESDAQVCVAWPFDTLSSRQRGHVRVRVHGAGASSPFSVPVPLEVGILSPGDWSAQWISPADGAGMHDPAPVLEGQFTPTGRVMSARLHASAMGIHVTELNGVPVSDDHFAPGWTSYQHRIRYHTYDITELVQGGTNTIRVTLGNGWWRGRLGWKGQGELYGDRLGYVGQIELEYEDGTRTTFGTDTSWRAGSSNILFNDFYDGQTIDLRIRGTACNEPVDVLDTDVAKLVAADGPPVRVTDELPAREVFRSPSGKLLVDFGQNLVGWVRLRIAHSQDGQEIVIRHAEILEDGELGTRPLRTAKATDRYILAAGADIVLEPSFTFHGFRYAEIDGLDDLDAADIVAIVLGTDLERTGTFACSNPELNQLHANVVWGMRGNFLEVPTDCPQRDERLGWTGDIQVFTPTATFLYDCAGFLTSWLKDLAVEQDEAGYVPFVIPDVLHDKNPAAAAWGDAATLVPMALYRATGDLDVLRMQYASMKAWTECERALAGDDLLWTGSIQFGDWLDPTAPPEDAGRSQVEPDLVATVYFAKSADAFAHAAEALGYDGDALEYRALADAIGAAILREWTDGNGRLHHESQTGYAMLIAFHVLEDDASIQMAGERLARLVVENEYRMSTGFVGTPIILDALCISGHAETAYRMLLQQECPGWLYPVTMGATTIWERWDSMLPDGSINPGEMTSFNHYALGAVADWMHRKLAGLAPASPGCRTIRIAPIPTASLTWAEARLQTPYGTPSVRWDRGDGEFRLQATIPVGSTADVQLPDGQMIEAVGGGYHTWTCPDPFA